MGDSPNRAARSLGLRVGSRPLGIRACRGLACSESLPNTYPGFPLGRARRTTSLQASPPALGLHGMVKTTCCSWLMRRDRSSPSQFTWRMYRRMPHVVRPRRPQYEPATHRRHIYTHVRIILRLAPYDLARPRRYAHTHVPGPHMRSQRTMLGVQNRSVILAL